MSTEDNDMLLFQIHEKYKNSWEQARLIASAFGGGDDIKFSWDNETDENESKHTTQQDILDAYNRYL